MYLLVSFRTENRIFATPDIFCPGLIHVKLLDV